MAHHDIVRSQRGKLDVVRVQIAKLTPRERQGFDLVVRGKINTQIARELGTKYGSLGWIVKAPFLVLGLRGDLTCA